MELMSEKKMNIPIVFISEKYDEEWIVNGVNENVLEVLPKPIDKEQLLLKVHRLLNDEFFDFYSGDDIG
jgi:DNA-binding response OmpR family regulator